MTFKQFKASIFHLSKKEQKWAYFFYFLDKTYLWKVKKLILTILIIISIALLTPFYVLGILTIKIFKWIYNTDFENKFWIFRKKRKEILKKIKKINFI